MTKQVTKAVEQTMADTSSNLQNLFVSVKTFGPDGRTVGERIVDMCHYGTRNWLSNHLWWATHNGHCTEVDLASPEEIEAFLAKGREALAAKYNASSVPAEPAQAA